MLNNAPEIFVVSPDRRETYGAVRMITEFTEDIRFNSCSEINIKVSEKMYDTNIEEWIENPIYNQLEKNNLLFVCDDKNYFSFPNRTIRNDYSIMPTSEFPTNYGRTTSQNNVSMTYDNSSQVLNGFEIQPEISIHNICVHQGYNWRNLCLLSERGINKQTDWENNYFRNVCKDYIPIEINDVVSIRGRMYKNAIYTENKFTNYFIYFYTDEDANTCVGSLYFGSTSPINPVVRFSINSLTINDDFEWEGNETEGETKEDYLVKFKNLMKNGGYMRIYSEANHLSGSYSEEAKKAYPAYYINKDGKKIMGYTYPYNGWIQIYSGNRYCTKIDNDLTDGNYELPMRWFVITSVENEYDGNYNYKEVKAYSYEYTLSNKTISLTEDTLPLYIPQQIIDIVTGDNWVIDKESGLDTLRTGGQNISRGLLNQILDIFPDWKIGHISSELMTRYRKIDSVDNSNLYSFLMNDVENLYQCYFVFDNCNKTISAYTQNDIVDNSNIVLNWNNALKSLKITDQDMNFMTALRVHTADDTYGVGLINPTGNSVIYNFNSILDKLDFVADNSNSDPLQRNIINVNGQVRKRTLKEAVLSFMDFINNPQIDIDIQVCSKIGEVISDRGDYETISENEYITKTFNISSLSQYRDISYKLIESNLLIIKSEGALQEYISDYNNVLNQIEVYAEVEKIENYYNVEKVLLPDEIAHISQNFISDELYNSIINASKKYYLAKREHEAKVNDYNSYLKILKTISQMLSLDYYKQRELTNQYINNSGIDKNRNTIVLSLLTPAEILALQPFIREGDWTNSNSTFSENYVTVDIINTLVDVYNQAKKDMDMFISKPSFDFDSTTINWTEIPEMRNHFKNLKVGKTIYINTKGKEYAVPILLEFHINHFDKEDFSIKFTTDYKRKPEMYRFADLYNTVSQVSVSNNTFSFEE